MHVLRTRFAAAVAALAFAAPVLAGCGDDDGKGAAEEIEKGAEKGADEAEKQGDELDDDLKGKDEKQQEDE